MLCGALAGLAGVVSAARFGTVSSSVGTGIELEAVGAAVIGGVAIFGGSGTVWGAALGAFLLVTINRSLPVLGISGFWQQAVVGALIVGAIVLDRVLVNRQERALVAARDTRSGSTHQGPPSLAPVVPRLHARFRLRVRGGRPMSTLTETPSAPATARTYAAYSRPFWQRVVFSREFAVIALLIAAIVYSRSQVDYFDGPQTMYYLFRDSASDPAPGAADDGDHHHRRDRPVGGVHRRPRPASRSACSTTTPGCSALVAAILAIGIGALCGAFNGFLVAYVGLPSIAVTIGTLALFRGIAAGLPRHGVAHRLPRRMDRLGQAAHRRGPAVPDDPDPVRDPGRSRSPCCCTSRRSAGASSRSA